MLLVRHHFGVTGSAISRHREWDPLVRLEAYSWVRLYVAKNRPSSAVPSVSYRAVLQLQQQGCCSLSVLLFESMSVTPFLYASKSTIMVDWIRVFFFSLKLLTVTAKWQSSSPHRWLYAGLIDARSCCLATSSLQLIKQRNIPANSSQHNPIYQSLYSSSYGKQLLY